MILKSRDLRLSTRTKVSRNLALKDAGQPEYMATLKYSTMWAKMMARPHATELSL